jgi:hypothetical protein
MTCRICLDDEENPLNLISPCNCKGTMQYVHRECFILSGVTDTSRCPICNGFWTGLPIEYSLLLIQLMMLVYHLLLATYGVYLCGIAQRLAWKSALDDKWVFVVSVYTAFLCYCLYRVRSQYYVFKEIAERPIRSGDLIAILITVFGILFPPLVVYYTLPKLFICKNLVRPFLFGLKGEFC